MSDVRRLWAEFRRELGDWGTVREDRGRLTLRYGGVGDPLIIGFGPMELFEIAAEPGQEPSEVHLPGWFWTEFGEVAATSRDDEVVFRGGQIKAKPSSIGSSRRKHPLPSPGGHWFAYPPPPGRSEPG